MPEQFANKFDVDLVAQTMDQEYIDKIVSSDVVVITEGNYHFRKADFNANQLVIDLWHGFPLKNIGYANKNEPYVESIQSVWSNIDIVGSYSPLYNELMEKCLPIGMSKFRVVGAPRNDFLYTEDGHTLLQKMLGIALDKKIIFYMPTWRHSPRSNTNDGKRHWENIFGMDCFDDSQFDSFLQSNNCILVVKLHPAEQAFFNEKIKSTDNIFLLGDHILASHGVDLYEVLNSTDILITDYSSVFFDFLLLDRPIVFTPTDIDTYCERRGFLLEPYDKWTPGEKALDQIDLESAIIESLLNPSKHAESRQEIRSVVHHFKDGNSSERVWNLIENIVFQKRIVV